MFGLFKRKKGNKYLNKKVIVEGVKFDSKKEAKRFQELRVLEWSGKIKDLELQPAFILQESFTHEFWGKKKNGENKRSGQIKYIADFKYFDVDKKRVIVEDVKSKFTRQDKVYRLKIKLFLSKFTDIEFREVVL